MHLFDVNVVIRDFLQFLAVISLEQKINVRFCSLWTTSVRTILKQNVSMPFEKFCHQKNCLNVCISHSPNFDQRSTSTKKDFFVLTKDGSIFKE